MTELQLKYGRMITPKELASFLRVDPRTVVKYAHRWGGIEISPGKYRFFENRIKEAIDAEYGDQERQTSLFGQRDGQQDQEAEDFPNGKKGGTGSGPLGRGRAGPYFQAGPIMCKLASY